MKIFFLICILVMLQACSNTEKKNPLNHLNGENYATADLYQTNGIPVTAIPVGAVSKERPTSLKGSVVLIQGAAHVPLKMQKVSILKDGKVLANTVTGIDGTFYFKGTYLNGFYELQSDSKTYQGSLKFQVNDYKHDNLVIIANLKK